MTTPRSRSYTTPPPPTAASGDPTRTPVPHATPRDACADSDSDAAEQSRLVDEESKQSFPASDPPSWTLGSR